MVATHAPGQSAYNAVERRMAPLSNELAGVILPYDTYGSHLNSSNKTIDRQLEMKNFASAGRSLAEIWSSMLISKFPVRAEYMDPSCEKPLLSNLLSFSRSKAHSTYLRHLQALFPIEEGYCRPQEGSNL